MFMFSRAVGAIYAFAILAALGGWVWLIYATISWAIRG